MTIGDEKVVAWLDEGGISWDTYEEALKFCVPPELPRGLIPQSTYAELAAERDDWKGRAEARTVAWKAMRAERDAAEAQLAELRGKVVALADELKKSADTGPIYGSTICEHISNRLRILAAADGGGA